MRVGVRVGVGGGRGGVRVGMGCRWMSEEEEGKEIRKYT